MFVWARASDIHPGLAITMAGVYGVGLLGGLLCVLYELVDNLLRTAWLLVESGSRAGRSKTLDARSTPVRIGSSPHCEMRFARDAEVERHQATVSHEDEVYVVEAVDGTTFAGPPDEAPAPTTRSALVDGSEILVGTVRLRFRENWGNA